MENLFIVYFWRRLSVISKNQNKVDFSASWFIQTKNLMFLY